MESAKLHVKNLPISTKNSVEICKFIRNLELNKAKTILSNVVQKKQAVPYFRYRKDTPHKPGLAAARFPVNASQHILKSLESVEQNALKSGMSTNLIISHISASKGAVQWHYGRQRRRKNKATSIRIILNEIKETKKEKPKNNTKKVETKK
ncbi:50S ribosomal protein L22 [archaeon]|jgi:large subunit ribosomal protein L22|nr:50S ribosomal protein L22 [archaeon]|tara:strand:- start:1327 stop:1779 length:453 start_codon:yes stop_codon:yes gene_type:complete